MANGPDYHIKLLIGDLAGRLALVLAENEALREQLAAVPTQDPPTAPKPEQTDARSPTP